MKVDRPMKKVKRKEQYTSKICKQNKNEVVYASRRGWGEFVLQQITNGLVGEKRRKLFYFTTLFCTLKDGKSMLECEFHKDLLDIWNLEENTNMHWSNTSS
jgi:hypothetical protein